MAGKHRKSRGRRSGVPRRWLPSVTAAAITATSLMTALTTGTTVTVASPVVDLAALITPANSTAQIFAGSEYYNQDWSSYGEPQVVPFFLGPQGIANAIHDADGEPIVVLASGWGAGQTGTALAILKANNDPAINDIDLVVLDNNTNRGGGGFWTTYSIFAPLLLTSGKATPSDTGIPVLDVGYDYNINGNAPTNPLNLFADVNSLVAYVLDYGGQAHAPVPQYIIDEAENQDPSVVHKHYVLNEDGTVAKDEFGNDMVYDLPGSTTTYVTFKSEHLPLVKPLLLIPGGEIIADLIEPTLTVLVNAGYKDNQPIPQDPRVVRHADLFPVAETVKAFQQLPDAVHQGISSAQQDLSEPGDLFTTSKQPNTTTINSFASNSSARSVPQVSKPGTSINPFAIQGNSKPATSTNKPSTPSFNSANNPVRQVVAGFKSAIDGLADSLTNGAKKPSDTETPTGTTPAN
jgi:hypothetical protein